MAADISSDNAYEILGVSRSASQAAIHSAWKKLALKYYPDAVPPAEKATAALRFALINQAHEVLRDPNKRRWYDAKLDRGITPDLSAEFSETATPGLAEILGEIQSLNLPVDQTALLARMHGMLRDELLLPALLDNVDVRETVIDAVGIEELVAVHGDDLPPGYFAEGWLVMTELRIIVLMRFVHQDGNTSYTYGRSRSFWYSSLTSFQVHEVGQAFRSYHIELEDEDEKTRTFEGTKIVQAARKTRFVLQLREVRLTRLFLVANTYRLPLKVVPVVGHVGEYRSALGMSMLLPLLWALPFVVTAVVMGSILMFTNAERREAVKLDLFAGCRSIYDFLGVCGFTTFVLYFSPLLFTYLCLRIGFSRESRKADEVLGKLPFDFASCAPAVLQEQQVPDAERGKNSPQDSGVDLIGLLKKVPDSERGKISPSARERATPVESTGQVPLSVEMPDAVREAMGREPSKQAFCQRCGERLSEGCAFCGKCGAKV